MSIQRAIQLSVLALALALPAGAWAFSYTGDCSNGCALGEDWTFDNANEIDTALDAIQGAGIVTTTSVATFTNEQALDALTNGLVRNNSGTLAIYAGTSCTNQAITALSAAGTATCATLTSAYIDAAITRDTESTLYCQSRQVFSPDGTQPILDYYGAPFATILVRYRCNVQPEASAVTVPITPVECVDGHGSCTNMTAFATECDSDGTGWVTSFVDSSVAADRIMGFFMDFPSDSLADGGSITIDLCYSRQVVE